jgi:protocatechuate 4,5-dioxygenase alpha subunit
MAKPLPPEILDIRSRALDFGKPIAGTYLTTGARAARGYRFSKFCMSLSHAAAREAFKADNEKFMSDAGLDDFEKQLVRDRDWNGMLRHGTSTFMVLKLSNALGVGQNRTGAAMRGQSYEDFMATRNVKEAN